MEHMCPIQVYLRGEKLMKRKEEMLHWKVRADHTGNHIALFNATLLRNKNR